LLQNHGIFIKNRSLEIAAAMSKAKAIVVENPQRKRREAGWCSEDLERKARYFFDFISKKYLPSYFLFL
jgi:hypothetical protein